MFMRDVGKSGRGLRRRPVVGLRSSCKSENRLESAAVSRHSRGRPHVRNGPEVDDVALKTTRSGVRRRPGLSGGLSRALVRPFEARTRKENLRRLIAGVALHKPDVVRNRKLRVLVAADEERSLNQASRYLTRCGMLVWKVQNPHLILPAAENFRPDVILIDEYFEKSRTPYSRIMPALLGRFPDVSVIITSRGQDSTSSAKGDPKAWGAKAVISRETLMHGSDLERSVIAAHTA